MSIEKLFCTRKLEMTFIARLKSQASSKKRRVLAAGGPKADWLFGQTPLNSRGHSASHQGKERLCPSPGPRCQVGWTHLTLLGPQIPAAARWLSGHQPCGCGRRWLLCLCRLQWAGPRPAMGPAPSSGGADNHRAALYCDGARR